MGIVLTNAQPSGFIPQSVQTNDNTADFADTRFLLKNSWNTAYSREIRRGLLRTGPFRAVNNAGDLLSRQAYSCGGSCQTPQSRPGLYGLKTGFGKTQSQCDGSRVMPATCNQKYVYDSSDYTRFLKQQAAHRNYNDPSYAGNNYSGAQSAMRDSMSF